MRVVHCKREPYDVYIGRPSKWGNPFSHKPGTRAEFQVATREEAIEAFSEWIKTQPNLLADLHELRGKILGCWCAPLPCHGDVLARLAGTAVKEPREAKNPMFRLMNAVRYAMENGGTKRDVRELVEAALAEYDHEAPKLDAG